MIARPPARRRREVTVLDERTDAELLIASRTEPEAFGELYRRHAEDVLRYLARRTLDPEAAAELTAETFAEAFASRANYRDQGVNGVAWLYGIARHRLGRFFRTGRVDAAARRKLGMPERDLPPRGLRAGRGSDRLRPRSVRRSIEALETLGDDQREAMRLRVIDGLDYSEVAERLTCTEQNARQRVSRGLRKIALLLAGAGHAARHGGGRMNTDIRSLQLLEARSRRGGLARARASHVGRRALDGDSGRAAAAFLGTRRRPGRGAGIAAALVAVLVLAGGIGFLSQLGTQSADSGDSGGSGASLEAGDAIDEGNSGGGGGAGSVPQATAARRHRFTEELGGVREPLRRGARGARLPGAGHSRPGRRGPAERGHPAATGQPHEDHP